MRRGPPAAPLLAVVAGLWPALEGAQQLRDVSRMHDVRITSFDGVVLSADAHVPLPRSSDELFPVVIFANSWASPEIEYLVESVKLAERGYLVLEYKTRGWPPSTGRIEGAGREDQLDTSVVVDFVLAQRSWQPDRSRVALAGISYGAGLALLGAAHDDRVTTAVAMSGWPDMERALFENGSPNRVWGDVLLASGRMSGVMDPIIQRMWKQVIAGNEPAFREWAAERSPATYADKLRARKVPLFLSNNLEDRLFEPQDMLDFFQSYPGPKKMLLNQGIHATAEIGGLLDIPGNHIWVEAQAWLDRWLKDAPSGGGPAKEEEAREENEVLVDVQLRSDRRVREQFAEWPSRRVASLEYTMGPRGLLGLHGSLLPPPLAAPAAAARGPAEETISFARMTGITAGIPIVGELLQVYVDARITSNLLLASRQHAIWYYGRLERETRLCGTPELSLDFSSSAARWQIVAYLFSVDWKDQGTLISHGSLTCWNCTAGQRQQRRLELRTLCEDVRGGLGLALNLYSDLYEPANTDAGLRVTFHYSDGFGLRVPEVLTGSREGPAAPLVV